MWDTYHELSLVPVEYVSFFDKTAKKGANESRIFT